MNSIEFTYLLQNPENLDAFKTKQLDEIVNEYPYFQSARAVQLKGLHKTTSFKYNQALKKTASYTIDRKVLFKFITSEIFTDLTNNEEVILEEIDVFKAETIKILHKKITEAVTNETVSIAIQKQNIEEKAIEILEIGKPINFKSSEPHSFDEWMQLIVQKPIIREELTNETVKENRKSDDTFNLIDRFIETNPKIKPIDKNLKAGDISFSSSTENESLMTETLAKVYLEQKKYENAIKAYHILSLKYPGKSGFFADRIKAIKILQKNIS